MAAAAAGNRRPDGAVLSLLGPGNQSLVRDGVRLSMIGRRDRLGEDLVAEVERTEAAFAERPDFDAPDLAVALAEFRHRKRAAGILQAAA
jgi:hypothetical protein